MKIPRHLAIIMDGNGRWAKLHGRERTFGHLRGARVAKNIIERCSALGVEYLTLYAFSTENWLRPKTEIFFLMQLLSRHLRKERQSLMKSNIQFSVIGDLDRLPEFVRAEAQKTIEETKHNTGLKLVFALSYGARQEITTAMQKLAREVAEGRLQPEQITDEKISGVLQTSHMPDPDLIIRTSGEYRLSNFLLWQAAYTELYISEILWPDFNADELDKAFVSFSNRDRRFGKTDSTSTLRALS